MIEKVLFRHLLRVTRRFDRQPMLKVTFPRPNAKEILAGHRVRGPSSSDSLQDAVLRKVSRKIYGRQGLLYTPHTSFEDLLRTGMRNPSDYLPVREHPYSPSAVQDVLFRFLRLLNNSQEGNEVYQESEDEKERVVEGWAHCTDEIRSGRVLVAHPMLNEDSMFARKVILLTEARKDGGWTGLIINTPPISSEDLRRRVEGKHTRRDSPFLGKTFEHTSEEFRALLALLSEHDVPTFDGGPLHGSLRLTVNRNVAKTDDGEEKLTEDDVWFSPGSDNASVMAMVRRKLMGEGSTEGFKLYTSVCGWTTGQLEAELACGDWFLCSVSHEHLVPTVVAADDGEAVWRDILHLLGGEYKTMR